MDNYVVKVKRQLRDKYGFTPSRVVGDDEPYFGKIPDGEYPMTIDGKLDRVKVINGKFSLCNWETEGEKA